MRILSKIEEIKKPVIGWRGLVAFTGLSLHFLQREIAYYEFPKPRHVLVSHKSSHSSTITKVWEEDDVTAWFATRKERPK